MSNPDDQAVWPLLQKQKLSVVNFAAEPQSESSTSVKFLSSRYAGIPGGGTMAATTNNFLAAGPGPSIFTFWLMGPGRCQTTNNF